MGIAVLARRKLDFGQKIFYYWHDTTNLQNRLNIIGLL